jgi:hypothetical protein
MTKNTENIILSHSGTLDFDRVNILLDKLQHELSIYSETTICKKRIYSTAVEALENILRHTGQNNVGKLPPHFSITKKTGFYTIESRNIVTKTQQKELIKKLEYINNNSHRINKVFAEKLKTSHISEEGGAGLGIYIIGKNASEKISYSFREINEKQSYFFLKIKI